MDFYCGVSDAKWNRHPVRPGPLACISPVYGSSERTARPSRATVPAGTQVLQDSGAFSDGPGQRLTLEQALARQIAHAERYGYASRVTHRASYDVLIDEVWTDGNRSKRRWSVRDADSAVRETVAAARYLAEQPRETKLVLSAQGVDAAQYLECVQEVAPLLESGDVLGLGGWCIIGKLPSVMMPVFRETIRRVIPWAGKQGIKQVHIWGVLYAPALGELLWLCDQHDIKVSTDSAGPVVRVAHGSWGYMGWTKLDYKRPEPEVRGLHMALHVQAVRCWLKSLRQTEYYREPPAMPRRVYQQLSLLEAS